MSENFDLAVARTMAEQMGGERTRILLLALCDEVARLRAEGGERLRLLQEISEENTRLRKEVNAERSDTVAWLRHFKNRSGEELWPDIRTGLHRSEATTP